MLSPEGSELAKVEQQLDRIVHLLTVLAAKDMEDKDLTHLFTALVAKGMDKKEAVLQLTSLGLAPKQIAGIVGLTPNYVSVILYESKQATTKPAKAPKSPKATA